MLYFSYSKEPEAGRKASGLWRGKGMLTIIEKAQKEISETGCLSVAARQQLWLALGPAEVNEQHPGPLTEAVRKRAQLALACGKKVSRVWSAYDAEDKRPQALLRKISAYLEGNAQQNSWISSCRKLTSCP